MDGKALLNNFSVSSLIKNPSGDESTSSVQHILQHKGHIWTVQITDMMIKCVCERVRQTERESFVGLAKESFRIAIVL